MALLTLAALPTESCPVAGAHLWHFTGQGRTIWISHHTGDTEPPEDALPESEIRCSICGTTSWISFPQEKLVTGSMSSTDLGLLEFMGFGPGGTASGVSLW